MLDRAAGAALRGAGLVEPNPLVGCVIGLREGRTLGIGHHRRFGEAHAEIEALRDCARRGADPRGATVWATLEPCSHTGKTGPCADALIEAGVARVVYAAADPNPVAAGGAARLRSAGVEVCLSAASARATRASDPFRRRMATGLPWVIAKWAQSIDGAVATSSGESKWISGPASRRQVHRLRARVDAVLTGIGTVLADDPLLTARGVHLRRVASRVVVDADLRIPVESGLVRSADRTPLIVATRGEVAEGAGAKVRALRGLGVEVVGFGRRSGYESGGWLDLESLLRWLAAARSVANVLVEAGPGLLGGLFAGDLVDEARVYVAPMVLGDAEAPRAARIGPAASLAVAHRMELLRAHPAGRDAMLWYRRPADEVTCPPAPLLEV